MFFLFYLFYFDKFTVIQNAGEKKIGINSALDTFSAKEKCPFKKFFKLSFWN